MNGMMKKEFKLFTPLSGEFHVFEWKVINYRLTDLDFFAFQIQYNIARKSASLASPTRKRLVLAICQATCTMCNILSSVSKSDRNNAQSEYANYLVPQSFRDAFACHLYMLYTIMIFTESEIKAGKALGNNTSTTGGKKSRAMNVKEKEKKVEAEQMQRLREQCASTLLTATSAMAQNKSTLWRRGVPDENVVGLPCRISYLILENATGVVARKMASGDIAMKIIAMTIDSVDSLISTIVAALVDLLHSFEHIAKLVSEMCCLVSKESENKFAIELMREIGRLDVSSGASSSETGGKASGIRNIAPFINELAERKPRLVLENIGLVLPHLQSEAYNLRSAIVTAIGHILICCTDENNEDEDNECEEQENQSEGSPKKKSRTLSDNKEELFDILLERARDVSSYTRVSVLKTWANLIENQSVPLNRLIPLTELAIDRLQDKTVMVRRSALQVRNIYLHILSIITYHRLNAQINVQ